MKKFIKSLMDFLWLPFMLPIIIAYLFAKEKSKIQKDLNAFSKVHYKQYPTNFKNSFIILNSEVCSTCVSVIGLNYSNSSCGLLFCFLCVLHHISLEVGSLSNTGIQQS